MSVKQILSKREKQLLRIKANDIIDSHCVNCKIKTKNRIMSERIADRYCVNECSIGQQLKEIGNIILTSK